MEGTELSFDSNSFPIDTMGRCFLCLIKAEEPEWESRRLPASSSSAVFSTSGSFQCLSRYLELDLEGILLLNKGRRAVISKSGEEEIKLDVKLCEECTMISEKLAELCQELGNCLKIIRNKLVKAEEMGLAEDVFRIRKSSNEDGEGQEDEIKPRRKRGRPSNKAQANLSKKGRLDVVVEELRREVIEKCSEKISALLPPTPSPMAHDFRGDSQNLEEAADSIHPFEGWSSSVPDSVTETQMAEKAPNLNLKWEVESPSNQFDFLDKDSDGGSDEEESDFEANSDENSRKSTTESSSDEEENDSDMDGDEKKTVGGGSGRARAADVTDLPYIIISPPNPPPGINPKPQRRFNPETGKHQCPLCSKEFRDAKQCREHYKTIHLELRYQCISCGKEYRCGKSAKLHYQAVHQGLSTPRKCPNCKGTFAGKIELKEHLRNMDTDCGQKRKMMRKRRATRLPKEKLKLSCDTCGKDFSHRSRLQFHINSVHLKIKASICDQCGMGFSKPEHLRRHVKVVHLNLREHVCEECGKGFNQLRNLEVHQKSVHLKLKDHLCQKCGRGFALPEILKKHVQQVHLKLGGKEWACETCGEKFYRKDYLTRHRRIAHPQDKRKIVSHGEKNKFVCPVCGTGFTRNSDLTRHHNVIHLGLNPHPCKKCELTFKWKKGLVRHMKKCHPEAIAEPPTAAPDVDNKLLHLCNKCDLKFKWRKGLVRHQKNCHPEETGVAEATADSEILPPEAMSEFFAEAVEVPI